MAVRGKISGTGKDYSSICVSLTAKGDEPIVYPSLPKDADPDDFIPLMNLFNSELEGKHQDQRYKYHKILLQYTISVIKIDDEQLNLSHVVEIFERLNLGGKN